MACLSFREATEVTFERQRADNLHLRAEVDALKASYDKLLNIGIDKTRLLTEQLKTEDTLRIKIERLKAFLAVQREMYQDRDSDLAFEFERANRLEAQNERLGEENERLTDDGVQYEHVQPNGKPILITENERLRAEVERLTAAQSHPAILQMPRKCSECERWDDWVDDEGTDPPPDGKLTSYVPQDDVRMVYAIRKHEHVLKEKP